MSETQTSNISYTSKDFQQVYPEILSESKKMSAKWDPEVTNETDPGIVFLKELAIAVDKCMYAGDKNALEAFPLSATQTETAHQIFKLLGYSPKWYTSSEIDVQFNWTDSSTDRSNLSATDTISIPSLVQVTNSDQSLVYTIMEPNTINIGDGETTCKSIAKEGKLKTLEFSSVQKITLSNLDENNRIYLSDYEVAENGVFIANYNSDGTISTDLWEKVDNIYTEGLNGRYFELGLDVISDSLYIQFPDNISSLIGSGLSIKYLISNGKDGNPSLGTISSFYNSLNGAITVQGQTSDYTISTDNFAISNIGIETYGTDKETLDEAYKSYKKTVNTFDTLVSCNDYANAVYNMDNVGNAFACDRTNDIQDSYNIVTNKNNTTTIKTIVENDLLNAFNLKLYVLQYVSPIDDSTNYNSTFEIYDTTLSTDILKNSSNELIKLLNDKKCIVHDFKPIEQNKIAMIKNYYPLDMVVIPTTTLTSTQRSAVANNIKLAVFEKLNSREIEFGESPDFEQITNILEQADTLIKNVSLAAFKYESYAYYYCGNESESIIISDDTTLTASEGWKSVVISDEYTSHLVGYYSGGEFKNYITDEVYPTSTLYDYSYLIDVKQHDDTYETDNRPTYGCIFTVNEESTTGKLELYSSRRNDFRNEIMAKCILAGVTPAFEIYNGDFDYQVSRSGSLIHSDLKAISSNLTLEFDLTENAAESYSLKENEVVQFLRTKTNKVLNLSTGLIVAYCSNSTASIPKNGIHTLASGEYLYVYNKTEENANFYVGYKYYQGTTFIPTFEMEPKTSSDIVDFGDTTPTDVDSNRSSALISNASEVSKIDGLKSDCLLTSVKNVQIVSKAIQELKRSKGDKWYIISNTSSYSSTEKSNVFYMTFSKVSTVSGTSSQYNYYYTLKNNEYIITTDQSTSSMLIYGAGTKLSCVSSSDVILTSKTLSFTQINLKGVNALKDYWKEVPQSFNDGILKVAEQEFINLTEGDTLTISKNTELGGNIYINKVEKDDDNNTSIITGLTISKPQIVAYQINETPYKNTSGTLISTTNLANGLDEDTKKQIATSLFDKLNDSGAYATNVSGYFQATAKENLKVSDDVKFTYNSSSRLESQITFTDSWCPIRVPDKTDKTQFRLVKLSSDTSATCSPSIYKDGSGNVVISATFPDDYKPKDTEQGEIVEYIDIIYVTGLEVTNTTTNTTYTKDWISSRIGRTKVNWEQTSGSSYLLKSVWFADMIASDEICNDVGTITSYLLPKITSETGEPGYITSDFTVSWIDSDKSQNNVKLLISTDEGKTVFEESATYLLSVKNMFINDWELLSRTNKEESEASELVDTYTHENIIELFSTDFSATLNNDPTPTFNVGDIVFKQNLSATAETTEADGTLSDYTITYEKDGSMETLPQISGDDEWKIDAYLNIVMDNETPMVLTDTNQSVTLYFKDGDSKIIKINTDTIQESDYIYLYCNNSLNVVGQSDAYTLDETALDGTKLNWLIYQCCNNNMVTSSTSNSDDTELSEEPNIDANVKYNSDNSITVTIENLSSQPTGSVKLSNGAWTKPSPFNTDGGFLIAKINNTGIQYSDDEYIYLGNSDSSQKIYFMFDKENYELNSSNVDSICYLNFENADKNTLYLHYNFPTNKYQNINLTLSPIKSRKMSESLSNCQDKFLDLNTGEFDLLYEVPDSVKISNPLVAETFLNKKHPYNKYTICKVSQINSQVR